MPRYIQAGIANSDIKDDYALIDYAKERLENPDIDSVEQAIEELESKTTLHEHWVSLENDTQTHEQAIEFLGEYFDIALEKYLESIGLMPNTIGLTDIEIQKRNEFVSANIEEFLTYYYEIKASSLEHSVQLWINQNYDTAIGKVLSYGTIISTLTDYARERITQAVPKIDQTELQSYLNSHVVEIQKQYPHFDQMIGMFQRRKESPSLDEEKVHNIIETAVQNHLNDWEFDNEHFQRGVESSVDAVIDKLTSYIMTNFDEITDSEIVQEVEEKFEDSGWDTTIAYEYLYDLQIKLEEYAENHNWDEILDITMNQTMSEDIIRKGKYADYNDDFDSFLKDYFSEELQKSKDIDESADLIGNFSFAFFSPNADLSDPKEAVEELYHYDSVDSFIEDFEDYFIDNIEIIEDDFAEWLVDNNEDYLDMTPNDAIQKFMEKPDWELYMRYIKSEQQGFETLTWVVPWTDEFYYSKEDLIRALSY